MALAARCPHCNALFRVVADQLKLRGGLVRCGACRQVFDAIGSLSYIDDQAVLLAPPGAPGREAMPAAAAAAPPAPAPRPAAPAPAAPAVPPQAAPAAARAAARSSHSVSPPTIMIELSDDFPLEPIDSARALDDISRPRAAAPAADEPAPPFEPVFEAPPVEAAGAASGAIVSSEPEPTSQVEDIEPVAADDGAADEPATQSEGASFLLAGEPPNQRLWRRVATVACGPLAVAAAFQGALALREPLLEAWPESHPLFVQACAWYGCSSSWPGRSDLLAVVGSELAAIPGTDAVELNASVRSRASFTMALPAIEVTLTDTQNRTVARKVFLPADYLVSSGEPSSRIDEGLAPNADLAIRLIFEARGLNASGFVVYPFYL